ncbi:MAG: hypothetical protein NTW16_06745 [Bacteroidetes bacterium]|nr:hypothetical protein [Bacteroidota bacterium]
MKNLFIIIGLMLVITGCNVQKDLTSNSVKSTRQSQSRSDESATLDKKIKTETLNSIITHVSEDCDTNVQTPGSNITGEKSLQDLTNGHPFELENHAVKGTVQYDSLTGKLNFLLQEKPKSFPVKFNRIIDRNETVNSQTTVNANLISSSRSRENDNSATTSKNITKQVKRTFPWWGIVCFVFLSACFVFVLVRFVRKRFLLK